MKIGLVARADDRGLGVMTWEFYRHVHPDRTLVVRHPSSEAAGFVQHVDRYPGETVVELEHPGRLDERVVRAWLRGLDVVYTAEVPYDGRLFEWCDELGVASVVHAMPESWRPEHMGKRTAVWAPTTWQLDSLPLARLVPVPIALDRFTVRPRDKLQTILHRAGHRLPGDRNGTTSLMSAVRLMREPVRVVVTTQDANLPAVRTWPGVDVEARVRCAGDYWDGYDEADVFVMPRRYGGLCLPLNEAAGAGCALVMSDNAPNPSTWPGLYVPSRPADYLETTIGPVLVSLTDHRRLAHELDALVREPARVHDLSCAAICWAQTNSWDTLLPTYLLELEWAAS